MQLVIPDNRKSYAFGDLTITDVNNYVVVQMYESGRKVLEEKYYKNKNRQVILRDVGTYLVRASEKKELQTGDEVICGKAIVADVKLIDENAEVQFDTADHPIVIFPCEEECNDIKYVPKAVLTRCKKKRTRANYIEYISAYEEEWMSVWVTFLTKNGEKVSKNVSKGHTLLNYDIEPLVFAHIFQYDISVKNLTSILINSYQMDVAEILEYSVKVTGSDVPREIHYEVEPEDVQDVKTFIFRNSFGGTETINTFMPQVAEYKWKRETGTIGRKAVSISNKLEKVFTVRTGAINREQVYAVEDMLNSTEVGLIVNNEVVPVVVLEETFKVSEARNELIDVEFSYKLASENRVVATNEIEQHTNTKVFSDVFSDVFR